MVFTTSIKCAMRELELLSVVALLEDSKAHKLLRSQAGTIVERLAPGARASNPHPIQRDDAALREMLSGLVEEASSRLMLRPP